MALNQRGLGRMAAIRGNWVCAVAPKNGNGLIDTWYALLAGFGKCRWPIPTSPGNILKNIMTCSSASFCCRTENFTFAVFFFSGSDGFIITMIGKWTFWLKKRLISSEVGKHQLNLPKFYFQLAHSHDNRRNKSLVRDNTVKFFLIQNRNWKPTTKNSPSSYTLPRDKKKVIRQIVSPFPREESSPFLVFVI